MAQNAPSFKNLLLPLLALLVLLGLLYARSQTDGPFESPPPATMIPE